MSDISRTIAKNESEIKKIITDSDLSSDFHDTVELYYNVSDIAKRAERMKKDIDPQIVKTVKSYFTHADDTITKALTVGELLARVGKDSQRTTTNYDVDNILSEMKKAMPKLEDLIDDIYNKHSELAKTPVSPRLYVFKHDEETKFKNIISGNMTEANDNIIKKILKLFSKNLSSHLQRFIGEKETIVDDIIGSLSPMTETVKVSNSNIIKLKEKIMSENNSRSSLLTNIKEKKNEISACLSEGVVNTELSELMTEYIAISDIASTASNMKKEISPLIKDEVTNLFDVEDAILNKFIEVGDYVVVVCKDHERINKNKALQGFVEELSKAVPEYADVIENIMKTNQDITKVDVKPRLGVKTVDESVVEALSSTFEKITKYVSNLTRVFSKYLPRLSSHNDILKSKLNMLYESVIVTENIVGDHFCVIQPNFAIFGVGKTENDAWIDAEEWADTTDENWKQSFEMKPCSQKLYKYVDANGTPDDWEEYEGVIVLADEISDTKSKVEESMI